MSLSPQVPYRHDSLPSFPLRKIAGRHRQGVTHQFISPHRPQAEADRQYDLHYCIWQAEQLRRFGPVAPTPPPDHDPKPSRLGPVHGPMPKHLALQQLRDVLVDESSLQELSEQLIPHPPHGYSEGTPYENPERFLKSNEIPEEVHQMVHKPHPPDGFEEMHEQYMAASYPVHERLPELRRRSFSGYPSKVKRLSLMTVSQREKPLMMKNPKHRRFSAPPEMSTMLQTQRSVKLHELEPHTAREKRQKKAFRQYKVPYTSRKQRSKSLMVESTRRNPEIESITAQAQPAARIRQRSSVLIRGLDLDTEIHAFTPPPTQRPVIPSISEPVQEENLKPVQDLTLLFMALSDHEAEITPRSLSKMVNKAGSLIPPVSTGAILSALMSISATSMPSVAFKDFHDWTLSSRSEASKDPASCLGPVIDTVVDRYKLNVALPLHIPRIKCAHDCSVCVSAHQPVGDIAEDPRALHPPTIIRTTLTATSERDTLDRCTISVDFVGNWKQGLMESPMLFLKPCGVSSQSAVFSLWDPSSTIVTDASAMVTLPDSREWQDLTFPVELEFSELSELEQVYAKVAVCGPQCFAEGRDTKSGHSYLGMSFSFETLKTVETGEPGVVGILVKLGLDLQKPIAGYVRDPSVLCPRNLEARDADNHVLLGLQQDRNVNAVSENFFITHISFTSELLEEL